MKLEDESELQLLKSGLLLCVFLAMLSVLCKAYLHGTVCLAHMCSLRKEVELRHAWQSAHVFSTVVLVVLRPAFLAEGIVTRPRKDKVPELCWG